MRIYFARHGESQTNLIHQISNRGLRHGLTPKGRTQAIALSQHLQTLSITHLYSSPLLRAIETSVIVANHLEIQYDVVDALREYDCGIAEGRSDEAAWQMWQDLYDAWSKHERWEQRIEGGESFHNVRDRFVPFIEGLVSQYRNTEARVVCVAHGGIYAMMLPLVLKNVDQALITRYGFDYTACILAELRPTGLWCIEWNGHTIEGIDEI